MKFFIASDIHGSALWCEKMMDAIAREAPDRVLLLGDLLYHGPRNDLPDDYRPKAVIEMLSTLTEKVLCVRGNCEAEVDQMVLPFPILSDSALVFWEGRVLYATHGHRFSEATPPPLPRGGLLLCGHTHVPAAVSHANFTYLNPGSVSLPKAGSPHSYAVLEGPVMTWKRLSDEKAFMHLTLPEQTAPREAT